jgi:hypothetical protein
MASQDFEEEALLLHSTVVDSGHGWDAAVGTYDVQEIEIAYPYDDYESMLRSAPLTPDLTWDSQPSSGADFSEEQLKSVFEDWDDVLPTYSGFNGKEEGRDIPHIQVVEEDGSQVLLIPAESDFYNEPEPPKKAFQFQFVDLPEVPSNTVIIIARGDRASNSDSEPRALTQNLSPTTAMRKGSGMMLFVDTTLLSATAWAVNSTTGTLTPSYLSPAFARSGVEDSTWVPKDTPTYMLDVPLDCHCSASPIEQLQSSWN